jgi:hypothetical protein
MIIYRIRYPFSKIWWEVEERSTICEMNQNAHSGGCTRKYLKFNGEANI